jgi:hypothetical protein
VKERQLDREDQTLEHMLRACALTMSGAWSDHLHLAEFTTTTITPVSAWHLLRHSKALPNPYLLGNGAPGMR